MSNYVDRRGSSITDEQYNILNSLPGYNLVARDEIGKWWVYTYWTGRSGKPFTTIVNDRNFSMYNTSSQEHASEAAAVHAHRNAVTLLQVALGPDGDGQPLTGLVARVHAALDGLNPNDPIDVAKAATRNRGWFQ